MRWTTPSHPELSFELGGGASSTPGFLRIDDAPIQRETGNERNYLPEIESRFPRVTRQEPELFRLLDVSSRADLFGVGYSPDLQRVEAMSGATLQLRGLDLIAPTRNVSAFTLPAFQWEPVYNVPNEDALPFPPKLFSSTDGGPTRFAIPAANLVPVAPLPVLDTFVTEYNRAIVGRTSREVVQVRSKLYPWGAIVVRTITMERTGSGGVFRRDSGWQAASDGDYKLPGCIVHPGVVPRLTNIRRIRDTTNIYERVYPPGETVKLTQVVFDADVEIEGVTLGANASRLVPTRDIIGYVQVLPVGADLSAEQLNDLLIAMGPIGGPIDCEFNVAQSGLHMRLSRIEVDRTATIAGNPQFVAVARGTTELPGAGQWTFAYRGPSETEPHRLEADRPIPLIRANPASGGVVPPYRFADPRELHPPNNPDSEYGLLHSTDAQRMLVPQPQVNWGDATIYSGSTLLFADMYTLGGGVALFPRPDQCHALPAGSVLRITGDLWCKYPSP